jgi:hypothetical protein
MAMRDRLIRRPPTWARIGGGFGVALTCYNLFDEPSSRNLLSAAVLCPVLLLAAIAPRWLYDDRGGQWERAHPIASGTLVFLFMVGVTISLLADSFSWRISLSVGIPAGLVLAVASIYFGRRRTADSRRDPQNN